MTFFNNRHKIALAVIFILFLSCNKNESPTELVDDSKTRSYYLGFTPFPYDASSEAVLYSYEKLRSDADIVAHHFDEGIPWPEAFNGSEFHQNIINDWQFRKANTGSGHKTYIAITPINFERNGLASYKGAEGGMPPPSPWDQYSFNHSDVKTAYLNFCKRVIEFFKPDFITIGIEVNLLISSDPSLGLWNSYLELHKFVFAELKNQFPNIVIMVSFAGMDLIDGYTQANHSLQMKGFNEMINYTDHYGISLYPFLSKFVADSLSITMLDNIFSLSDKPISICESGYPAEQFSVFGGSISINGSEEKQENYLRLLFEAADNYNVNYIINFVIRDYDNLWVVLGSKDDVTILWRDSGFYNESGHPRRALHLWKEKLKLLIQ